MKIVSLIASYSPANIYLPQVVEELRKVGKVVIFTTEQVDIEVDEIHQYPKSIGRDLVYKPREWVLNNLDQEWDYVLYNEDDILIPSSSVQAVIELYNTLPEDYMPGFIRYEEKVETGDKVYFDMNPLHAVHRRDGYGIVKNVYKEYGVWEPFNLHSGNWILSKQDINNMIQHNVFETYYKEYGFQYGNCDQLESAASVPYMSYTKVFPIDIESVECKHLPEKYIHMSELNPTLETLQTLISNVNSDT